MTRQIDRELRSKVHLIDKEFRKFSKSLEKKYGIFISNTGSIEFNSLTFLLTDEDAKKIMQKEKYQEWLRSRP